MLAGDAQGRAVFHQAHVADVRHLGTADPLVDPADDIAEDALQIIVQLLADFLGRPVLALGKRRLEQGAKPGLGPPRQRSEEHTSELQSLMRTSYAVFCLKKKQRQ